MQFWKKLKIIFCIIIITFCVLPLHLFFVSCHYIMYLSMKHNICVGLSCGWKVYSSLFSLFSKFCQKQPELLDIVSWILYFHVFFQFVLKPISSSTFYSCFVIGMYSMYVFGPSPGGSGLLHWHCNPITTTTESSIIHSPSSASSSATAIKTAHYMQFELFWKAIRIKGKNRYENSFVLNALQEGVEAQLNTRSLSSAFKKIITMFRFCILSDQLINRGICIIIIKCMSKQTNLLCFYTHGWTCTRVQA